MILGTGIDVVHIPALADQLRVPGSPWLDRVLTARELRHVRARLAAFTTADEDVNALALHVGTRWAAKEAVVKAWSAALRGYPPPISEEELDYREIEVVHDHWGRPSIELHGRVARAVTDSLTTHATPLGPAAPDPDAPAQTPVTWHVSLSHDGDTAMAMVILEGPTA